MGVNLSNPSAAHERLEEAAEAAVARLELSTGARLVSDVDFVFPVDDLFRASVHLDNSRYRIAINQGVVREVDAFWDTVKALADHQKKRGGDQPPQTSPVDLVEMANLTLEWLVLHELVHVRLGHVDIMEGCELLEIEADEPENRSSPGSRVRAELRVRFPDVSDAELRKCIEISADSQATQILFGEYDPADLDRLRQRAGAAFVAMTLIERHASKKRLTHPGANTRFFLVFAHLFQMWLQPNVTLSMEKGDAWLRRSAELDPQAYEMFIHCLIKPCVNDAAEIAHLGGAQSFIEDMRNDGALFLDIETVQYGGDLTPDTLKTQAAREWLELRAISRSLMAVIRDESRLGG